MFSKWIAAGAAVLTFHAAVQAADVKEAVQVEVVGTLQTGIAAIGGETTGTLITAKGITWEVQPPKGVDVEKLNKKKVKVTGTLTRKEGVEIKERTILNADSIKEAGEKDEEMVKVTMTGKVKTGIVAIGGETTGTVMSATGFSWELDLKKDKEWQALAEKEGKDRAFTVTGTLQIKKPVTGRRDRWIVTVDSFKMIEGK